MILRTTCALLILTFFCGDRIQAQSTSADFLTEFSACFDKADAQCLCELFAADAVLTYKSGKSITGKKAICEWYGQSLKKGMKLEVIQEDELDMGEFVATRGSFKVCQEGLTDCGTVVRIGTYQSIMRKVGDTRRIVRHYVADEIKSIPMGGGASKGEKAGNKDNSN